jgi:hypothetical protein
VDRFFERVRGFALVFAGGMQDSGYRVLRCRDVSGAGR